MKYELEIQALLRKAERSLRASKILIESNDYDFSLSRVYYVMFYCAEALLLTKDLKFSKHSAIIAAFGRDFVKTGLLPQELHVYLIKAFRERQIGDYETINLPSIEDAEEMAEYAEAFLEATRAYLINLGYRI